MLTKRIVSTYKANRAGKAVKAGKTVEFRRCFIKNRHYNRRMSKSADKMERIREKP